MRGVFSQVQRPLAREVKVHFARGFGFGRELKFNLYAVNHMQLVLGFNGLGGRKQAGWSHGHGFAQARIDLPGGPLGQCGPKLELRPPCHRCAANHVFGHRVVHKSGRCNDVHLARIHLRLGAQACHATKVVAMAVAIHDGVQLAFTLGVPVFAVQRKRSCCCSRSRERIQRNQTGIAFDIGDIGNVIPAHLKYARCHLKQPVNAV